MNGYSLFALLDDLGVGHKWIMLMLICIPVAISAHGITLGHTAHTLCIWHGASWTHE